MAYLSLLLVSRDPGPMLGRLVASWDGQSAGLDDFEVVVIDAGSTDGTADRLRQLSERRPNITVLDASSDLDDDALLAQALERATGRYVVPLRQTQRLTPRAVDLLKQQAEASGADVVIGRAVTASGSSAYHFPARLEAITPAQAIRAWPGSCAAIRREVVLGSPDLAAALGSPATLVTRLGTVAATGTTAVAMDIDLPTGDESALQLAESQVRWEGAVLQFEARAMLAQPVEGEPAAWLVAARADGLAEIAVPASVERGDEPVDLAKDGNDAPQNPIRLRATLDPATADSGAELADGVWNLRIRLASPDWEASAPLPPVKIPSAVVDGRMFTLPAPRSGQQLDVGATRSSVVGAVRPADASVVESVAGSLLTLRYPNLHVHGDSAVGARLRLDNFALPAKLVTEDGEARLESFVSGLAGSSVITVLAGKGKPSRTGLTLRISGTGQMTIEPTPAPPTPKAPAAAGRVGPAQAKPSSMPLVQRLRRLAPASIDPVIGRLSRVEPLRNLYRRLIGR